MSEPFKVYVNKTMFFTGENDTQITFYFEKPFIDEDGQVKLSREELGTVVMSNNYSEKFLQAMIENKKEASKENTQLVKVPKDE